MEMFRLRKTLTQTIRESLAIGLAVPLFLLLTVSASYAQAPALPAFQATDKSPNFKDGKVLLEERRIRAYTYLGGDENIIRQTVHRIVRQEGDAPGGWVQHEWERSRQILRGSRRYAREGRSAAQSALDARYMTSSVYYALAWFPNITSEQEATAYNAQLRAYQKGGKLAIRN